MRKNLFISVFLLFASVSISAHGIDHHGGQNQQEVKVKTIKITDKIYMLQGIGGNIGVSAGEDGILMIDDDYSKLSEKISNALKELGSPYPKFLFNTHWHGDHTEGNKFFGKNSLIISHENVRKRLSVDTIIFGEKSPAFPQYALPMITFEQSISIHFNGEEVKAIHYSNAHTDGDSVIFFPKSNVVHMGDLYFRNFYPFVDLASGGSIDGLIKRIGEIIQRLPADVKIIPGHGPLATLDELKAYHEMLKDTSAIIQKGIKKKKTLDQLKKDGLPAKYADFGKFFIKEDFWIETIYKSLTKK